MGWENFLHQNDDPTDAFTQHRAQMRHYDAFTANTTQVGPGVWTYGSGMGGTTVTYHTGGDVVHNPGNKVTRGAAAGAEKSGGELSGGVNLNPVLEPDNTVIAVGGLTWEPHPGNSDIESGAERRYGDVGALPWVLANYGADIWHNLNRVRDHFNIELKSQPEPEAVPLVSPTFEQMLDNAIATGLGQPRPAYHGF